MTQVSTRRRAGARWSALRDVRVIVTRPEGRATALLELLSSAGARSVHCPITSFAPPASYDELDGEITRSASYDWILWTSVHAVDSVVERAHAIGQAAALCESRHAAIGASTARALHDAGLEPHFIASGGNARAMALELPAKAGEHTLFLRASAARRDLPALLKRRGVRVVEVVAYVTVGAGGGESLTHVLPLRQSDVITFCSPLAVHGFIDACESANPSLPRATLPTVVCLGDTSATAAKARGWFPTAVAAAPTMEDLMDAMSLAVAT